MHSWSFTESQYTTNKYHNNYKNTEALTVVLIDFYNLCKKGWSFYFCHIFKICYSSHIYKLHFS